VNEAVHYEKPLFLVPVCYDHPQIAQQCIDLKIGINILKSKLPLIIPNFNPKGYKK
jgi:UDP:flavonoid glycosyltransferase YjiC (YdhE family)